MCGCWCFALIGISIESRMKTTKHQTEQRGSSNICRFVFVQTTHTPIQCIWTSIYKCIHTQRDLWLENIQVAIVVVVSMAQNAAHKSTNNNPFVGLGRDHRLLGAYRKCHQSVWKCLTAFWVQRRGSYGCTAMWWSPNCPTQFPRNLTVLYIDFALSLSIYRSATRCKRCFIMRFMLQSHLNSVNLLFYVQIVILRVLLYDIGRWDDDIIFQ